MPIPDLEALADKIEMMEAIAKGYWLRLEYIAQTAPQLLNRFELRSTGVVTEIKSGHIAAARGKLAEANLVTPDQFDAACKPSFPKLAEYVAVNKGCGEKQARKEIERTLANMIAKKAKKPTIAEKKPAPELPGAEPQETTS
jgi:hypothetical protein